MSAGAHGQVNAEAVLPPLAFLREYVEPAIALWRERPNVPVLAACAIAQIDILAEIVATDQNGGPLPLGGAGRFRDELGRQEPALARIRDAHDSHKHGQLTRRSADEITEGQRPYQSAGTALFVDDGFWGDFLGETSTAVLLDNGTPVDVGTLIHEAMAAWGRQLRRLNYVSD